MRKLIGRDVMTFSRLLKKAGVKDAIRKAAEAAETAAEAKDALAAKFGSGFEMLWCLFDALTEQAAERYIWEFLSGPFEMAPEEVADLELGTLINMVTRLAEENDLAGFFNFAAKSTK